MRNPRAALAILRVVVAVFLIVHGVARVALGIVDDFGLFLGASGLPFGVAIAWLLTIVEIAGGLLLALGKLITPLCVWFSLELLAGIFLVHAREGWFVVGAGRNGMEYSVLLIVCLLVVAVASDPPARQRLTT